MPWSEDEVHRWLARWERPAMLAGSQGHDAAVLTRGRGRPVLCTDQSIEGVHFEVGTRPERAARKAVARVLSDLAATASTPRAVLVALGAPAERETREIRAYLRGARRMALSAGADVVGGDLAARPGPLSLAVQGYGEYEGARPPGRDRARPGDVILCTGPTGGSPLGRHLAFVPRLAEGRWLHAHGARALQDVSDGLAIDLERLARASGVRIDLESVPVHRDAARLAARTGRPARWHALHDGEDHELLAAVPARRVRRLLDARERNAPGLAVLGRVRSGSGLWIAAEGGRLVRWRREPGEGWLHGG